MSAPAQTEVPAELDQRSRALARVVAWYRDMGVDAVVGDAPVDWLDAAAAERAPGAGFALPAAPPMPTGRPAQAPATVAAARPPTAPGPAQAPALPSRSGPSAASTSLATSLRTIDTLEALRAEVARFEGCALKATAKNLCLFRGAERARVMIIGEAPGRDEDLAGKPFVGRAGQLLDRMLAAIGLDETSVHITNTVYWRPPGNRQPTPQETLACRPFLDRQIELVAPEIIVLMGGIAASSMLATTAGITRLRGKWTTLERSGQPPLKALPTLHPAYLLRTPAAKRQAWHDLRLIRAALAPT